MTQEQQHQGPICYIRDHIFNSGFTKNHHHLVYSIHGADRSGKTLLFQTCSAENMPIFPHAGLSRSCFSWTIAISSPFACCQPSIFLQRGFYCQARFHDLLASLPLKEKLLFPPCLWMIKKEKTELQISQVSFLRSSHKFEGRSCGQDMHFLTCPTPRGPLGSPGLSAGQHNMPSGADAACRADHPSYP